MVLYDTDLNITRLECKVKNCNKCNV